MNDHKCNYHYRQMWTEYHFKMGIWISEKIKVRECAECGKSGYVSRLPVARRAYCQMAENRNSVERPNSTISEAVFAVLRVLYQKKNSVSYRVLVQDITHRGFSLFQIDESISFLFQNGWLLRHEKRTGTSRWEVLKLEIMASRWHEVEEILGISQNDMSGTLKKLSLISTDKEVEPLAERIRRLLIGQYEQLCSKGVAVLSLAERTIASSKYHEKYEIIINTLLEIYGLVKNHGRISFRSLAQRITGDSKGLSPYKREIEQLLGIDLREADIYDHSDLCYVSGGFTYKVRDFVGNGKSGYPYLVLTEETVAEMEIVETPESRMLVVENLTVFEEILRRGYYKRNDVIVLYSQGYISQVQMTLILKLLTYGNLSEVLMWADPDPYGIDIFRDLCRRLEETSAKVKPVMMDRSSCQRLSVMKPLENADRTLLTNSSQDGLPEDMQELWQYFIESGLKGEQEGFLEEMSDKELLKIMPCD